MPAEGITPGRRECHDGQPDRRRVDWVYPAAHPRPLALEVTSIVSTVDMRGTPAAQALSDRLSRRAETEALGAWRVAVDTEQDLRAAEEHILDLIRQAQPIREEMLESDGYIRPGWYTVDDIMRRRPENRSAFIAEHQRLKGLGIVEIRPISYSKREHAVIVLPLRGAVVGGFFTELEARVANRAPMLEAEAADLERHLGILVHRWDVSNEPEATPVPEIPAQIDVLWVVHRWRQDFDWLPVWVARRGYPAWRVYEA